MKAIYPDGMVRLAGYSHGASVAIEMALQLQQQGSGGSVQSVVLLDGSHSLVTAYIQAGRRLQRVASSDDTPSIETRIICAFVFLIVLRLVHSEEVCYLYSRRMTLNCRLLFGLHHQVAVMSCSTSESFDSLHC